MDWLNFFRIVGYIALFLGAVCTIGVDYLKNQRDIKDDVKKGSQMKELLSDVKSSKELLEPFIKLASTKYPENDVQDALTKLANEIKETKELAKPPILTLYFREVTEAINGLTLQVQLAPSKDVHLGLLEFQIEILNPDSKILSIWPSSYGGPFIAYDDTKQISENGMEAKLKYSIAGAGVPTFDITVSEETGVKISNKYLEEPILLNIVKGE